MNKVGLELFRNYLKADEMFILSSRKGCEENR